MLVLSRKVGERIQIGRNICIMVTRVDGGKVRLGIDAPRDVSVLRGEIADVAWHHDAADSVGATSAAAMALARAR
jgi:carbon storage regulator